MAKADGEVCKTDEQRFDALEAKIKKLENRIEKLESDSEGSRPDTGGAANEGGFSQKKNNGQVFPFLDYKMKKVEPWETYVSIYKRLLLYYNVRAGDMKVAEYGEGSLIRKLWQDHVSLFIDGKHQATLFEHIMPSLDPRYFPSRGFTVKDAQGSVVMQGSEESWVKVWWRGERAGNEFVTSDGTWYLSRRVRTQKGLEKWNIVEKYTGRVAATMAQSTVCNKPKPCVETWDNSLMRDTQLDPRIPGFFSSYIMSENQTTTMDVVQGFVFPLMLVLIFLSPAVFVLTARLRLGT